MFAELYPGWPHGCIWQCIHAIHILHFHLLHQVSPRPHVQDKVLPALQLDVDLDELDYYILMWRLQPYTHRGLFEQLLHSEQLQDQETQQLLLELDCAG